MGLSRACGIHRALCVCISTSRLYTHTSIHAPAVKVQKDGIDHLYHPGVNLQVSCDYPLVVTYQRLALSPSKVVGFVQ